MKPNQVGIKDLFGLILIVIIYIPIRGFIEFHESQRNAQEKQVPIEEDSKRTDCRQQSFDMK